MIDHGFSDFVDKAKAPAVPTPRRAASSFAPNERVAVNTRVTLETRRWLEERADAHGRTMASDFEFLLEDFRRLETDFGGQREFDFWRATAMAVTARSGAGWLSRAADVCAANDIVAQAFSVERARFDDAALIVAAAQRALEQFDVTGAPHWVKVARDLIELADELNAPPDQREGDAGRGEALREIVAAGHRLIDELAVTRDPRRRAHLQYLLRQMSGLTRLPASARETFARASSDPYVHRLPIGYSPSAPAREETRPRAQHLFEAAWRLATVEAMNRVADPPDEVIAGTFAASPELVRMAELAPPQTAAAILEHRAQIEQVKAAAIVPSAPASASSKPRRRRRAVSVKS